MNLNLYDLLLNDVHYANTGQSIDLILLHIAANQNII